MQKGYLGVPACDPPGYQGGCEVSQSPVNAAIDDIGRALSALHDAVDSAEGRFETALRPDATNECKAPSANPESQLHDRLLCIAESIWREKSRINRLVERSTL